MCLGRVPQENESEQADILAWTWGDIVSAKMRAKATKTKSNPKRNDF